jgi:hypothetical protein
MNKTLSLNKYPNPETFERDFLIGFLINYIYDKHILILQQQLNHTSEEDAYMDQAYVMGIISGSSQVNPDFSYLLWKLMVKGDDIQSIFKEKENITFHTKALVKYVYDKLSPNMAHIIEYIKKI